MDDTEVTGVGAPEGDDPSWAEYLRTSEIMSNVPIIRHPSERVIVVIPPRPPVWNPAVRAIVALPALWVLVNLVLGLAGGLKWWIIFTTLALVSAASVILARADRRTLESEGHDETATPWWATVPLVYLTHRAALVYRANSIGYRPLWAYLCVILGLLLAAFVFTLWSGAMIEIAKVWAFYGL